MSLHATNYLIGRRGESNIKEIAFISDKKPYIDFWKQECDKLAKDDLID